MVLPHNFYSIFLVLLQNKMYKLWCYLFHSMSISIQNTFKEYKVPNSGFWVKIIFLDQGFYSNILYFGSIPTKSNSGARQIQLITKDCHYLNAQRWIEGSKYVLGSGILRNTLLGSGIFCNIVMEIFELQTLWHLSNAGNLW